MNREQMIAWLMLEGLQLFTAPIIGAPIGETVYEAWDGDYVVQRYTFKPDTWDRYLGAGVSEMHKNRTPMNFADLPKHVLEDLYHEVMEHRNEP